MSSQAPQHPGHRPKLYVGTACDQCFRTKARCAGEKPHCTRCRNNQTPCTYSTGSRKKQNSDRKVLKNSTSSSRDPPPSPYRPTENERSTQADQQADLPKQASLESISRLGYPTNLPPNPQHVESLQFSESIGSQASLSPNDLSSGVISDWAKWMPESNQYPPAFAEVNSHTPESIDLGAESSMVIPENVEHRALDDARPRTENTLGIVCHPASSTMATDNNNNSNSNSLGDTLARLHAYSLDVSHDTPGEIIAALQRSLSIVCTYISSIEALDKNLASISFSNLDPSSSNASAVPQSSATLAITCVYTIQLAFGCYLKMRKQHRPAAASTKPLSTGSQYPTPQSETGCFFNSSHESAALENQTSVPRPRSTSVNIAMSVEQEHMGIGSTSIESSGLESLLDFYLTRDIRLCQKLAQRLSRWCNELACSARANPERRSCSQSNEMASVMEAMNSSLKVCSSMSI